MMQTLAHLGIPVIGNEFPVLQGFALPREYNPKGYWELYAHEWDILVSDFPYGQQMAVKMMPSKLETLDRDAVSVIITERRDREAQEISLDKVFADYDLIEHGKMGMYIDAVKAHVYEFADKGEYLTVYLEDMLENPVREIGRVQKHLGLINVNPLKAINNVETRSWGGQVQRDPVHEPPPPESETEEGRSSHSSIHG